MNERRFESIGRYIYFFSHLDATVRVVAQDLLGLTNDQYYGVMPVIDFVSACNICKSQIPANIQADKIQRALDLINQALNCNADRVRVARGNWLPSRGSQAIAKHTSRTTLKEAMYFAEPGELDAKAKEVSDLSIQIWDFFIGLPPDDSP